ncbi:MULTISPECIES: DUF302 domain-containing protein [Nocardioides]|uniref:Uncharacterized protein (DUF302 family) n=1 Tax=Nocardioides salarius TaxID=374513 RepID=A0ABS2MEU9_9ACTN|nr:DUF302 domain-containing protein [Nocardioides salarius]MBM7509723.1 uncharacterized protein (DUF302 family) [Nocardioides salarius]
MSSYTISTTLDRPYDETVEAVREQLAEAGFGVLTEIDLKATLKKKLDVDVAPQVILGACRPQLAHQALEVEPSIAALLPCNVVVRALDDTTTVVEAFDPDVMMSVGLGDADGPAGDAIRSVATDARERLSKALASLEGTT